MEYLLYTRDTRDNLRSWQAEINPEDSTQYRVISGLVDGQKVTTKWKQAKEKNVGRANYVSASDQAISEIESLITKKTKLGYSADPETAGTVLFFEPMLAHKIEDKGKKMPAEVMFQPKLDGIRCIATRHGMYTRNGELITSCPHIRTSLESFFSHYPDATLDGELYNHALKDEFNQIQSMICTSSERKLTPEFIANTEEYVEYHVYDMPILESEDDLEQPYRERYINLKLVAGLDYIEIVSTFIGKLEDRADYLSKFMELGYEGSMIRNPAGKYKQSRSADLLKDKTFQDIEVEIVRLIEGEGNWSGAVKHVEYKHPEGKLVNGRNPKAGVSGSYTLNATRLAEAELYEGGQATIKFQNYTPDGIPRFPIATALWKGKRNL